MRDGRSCIDASTLSNDSNKKLFEATLPRVYQYMAATLESRGVYDQALQYAKESLNLDPSGAAAMDIEARVFEDLGRYSECVSAAKQAIRQSDGKFSYMQFQLGKCYFHSESWAQAVASFKLAAEGNKTDSAAAFNVALSLQREGFTVDAREWFAEALRRNPDPALRKEIEALLR